MVYCGSKKPELNSFLFNFAKELTDFQTYKPIGDFYVKISSCVFVCDSPARSFLQAVKGHSGYNACPYCRIEGEYIGRKIFFPPTPGIEQRITVVYSEMKESNQISISPLQNLVSLRNNFPPDYLHTVCLGVVKRLILSYLTTTFGHHDCYLSPSIRAQLHKT